MFSRKKLVIAASTICLITVTLFLQIGVFANQTQTTAGDFTIDAEAYDVFYDCNRDGKVDMVDIFGCILRYGTEGDPVRTGYIAFSPSAFTATEETQPYYFNDEIFTGAGFFWAHVHLPHGANVTRMTVRLMDSVTDGYVALHLFRVEPTGSMSMASVFSGVPETPGVVDMVDDTINYPTVDNINCHYSLSFFLSYETLNLCIYRVVIEYEYTP